MKTLSIRSLFSEISEKERERCAWVIKRLMELHPEAREVLEKALRMIQKP